jgi:CBS domain-containing protein
MNVGNLCQHEVVTVSPDSGLVPAAHLMRTGHVGYLVVIEPMQEEGAYRVVGVLTDRDIVVAVVAGGAEPRTLTVGDVMTREPLTVSEDMPLEAALVRMQGCGVRRVPVLNADGALKGVLALDDALNSVVAQLNKISGCISSEQKMERYMRS